MTGSALFHMLKSMPSNQIPDIVLIIDEFDSLLLNLRDETKELISLLMGVKLIFAMTGSDLQPYHL